MEFLPEEIDRYVTDHTQPENELLTSLNRETWSKMIQPRMLSGHLQGRVLSQLSHMIKPQRILEIGTFTGYSALCLAEGLAESGKIITLDVNEEFEVMARKYFDQSPLGSKIDMRIGNALDIIPKLEEEFDMVFIDADKENYGNYYDLVFDKVKTGGYVIADNVLWSGKVVEDINDPETEAIDQYNKKVRSDNRVETTLFPIRDGLMISRKL
jgi:caffeoyl-CoA O-methyltransferase